MVDREIDADLRRAARPAVHRGLDHPQLRVQPGRRRPDRQRLVERRPAAPTCSPRPAPQAGADAVLQTSDDGWTCGTPLAALTDDRNAMLAVAMNGEPLPIEHGFPVRTIVPGLYGYVSACKWVVDMEVTRFDEISAYWTERGWGEQGPVKMASRIDVPRSGAEVPAGEVTLRRRRLGAAHRHRGRGVRRRRRRLADRRDRRAVPTDDTWVQWAGDGRRRGGRPHRAGARDRQGRHRADRRRAGRRCPTARPGGTPSTSRALT